MDIAFLFPNGQAPADISLIGPVLTTGADLETAIIISLFTDRRADDDDPIDNTSDRRGWWGDTFADVEGDKIGSRLWELAREKQTQDTLNRAQFYIQEALAWLVEDGVADAVIVDCQWIQMGVMGASIEIDRPNVQPEKFFYQFAWDELAA